MSLLRRLAKRTGAQIDGLLDRVRAQRRQGPLRIAAYRGYGTPETLCLRGRVLIGDVLQPAGRSDTRMTNLRAAMQRFDSREVADAPILASYGGVTSRVVTDDEGYFWVNLKPLALPTTQRWHPIQLELQSATNATISMARGRVLVPDSSAHFGVISDIDDTILQTHATSPLRMAWVTFFGNAYTRQPFDGVSQLYQAFHHQSAQAGLNPFFYVSSSPWNLYDLLEAFLQLNDFPEGPILLTDYGFDREKLLKASHAEHKLTHIGAILKTYPQLPFVLFGDSGQQDPEIYLDAVRSHPGRIAAIYIRNIGGHQRIRAVARIAAAVRAAGSVLVLADTTAKIADHARRSGFIA
jgi:phosphatidate phosphatase APP1